MAARILDQYLAHDAGRYSKEMGTILPLWNVVAHQPDVCFMNQSSTLEGVVRAFPLQVMMRDLMEFFVDERYQIVQRLLIPAAPTHQ
jgi:hypothetical protein